MMLNRTRSESLNKNINILTGWGKIYEKGCLPYSDRHCRRVTQLCSVGVSKRLPTIGRPRGPGGSGRPEYLLFRFEIQWIVKSAVKQTTTSSQETAMFAVSALQLPEQLKPYYTPHTASFYSHVKWFFLPMDRYSLVKTEQWYVNAYSHVRAAERFVWSAYTKRGKQG